MAQKREPTIFVSIASYNDPMLPHTLDNCLANARRPDAVRFGICWQSDPKEPVDVERFKRDPRFRIYECLTSESEGGSWARNIAQSHWDGETYSMQVDSHMAFAPGWDASLIRMMEGLPADKPLITVNAPLFEMGPDETVCRSDMGNCVSALSSWDEDMGWSPWFVWGARVRNGTGPVRNRFLSGNFIFSLGEWTDAVRQDPEHYYWGEEFAITLRSYTHGYDFFVPDDLVVWHLHHTAAPPRRHWEHGDQVIRAKNKTAFERLHWLAYSDDPKATKPLGRYGLGSQRTRAEFERFSGMKLDAKLAHPDAFEGLPPNPNTITTDADWDDCISFEAYTKLRDSKS